MKYSNKIRTRATTHVSYLNIISDPSYNIGHNLIAYFFTRKLKKKKSKKNQERRQDLVVLVMLVLGKKFS